MGKSAPKAKAPWPVLKRYTGEQLTRIAMPLGGIGTGTISLGGRGQLIDWELRDHPDKGFAPTESFFALWTRDKAGHSTTRCLEGAIHPSQHERAQSGGPDKATLANASLPRFAGCSFEAAYPLAQVNLSDPGVPLRVRIEAINPMVPADADASSWPVAMLRFVLENPTSSPVEAAVAGSVRNFLGDKNTRRVNSLRRGQGVTGVVLNAPDLPENSIQRGQLCLSLLSARSVTHRTHWLSGRWGQGLLDFWDDFSDDGRLEPRPQGQEPIASLASRLRVPPKASRNLTFLLTWRFPNRRPWQKGDECDTKGLTNHYPCRFADAFEVAEKFARRRKRLEADTVEFVQAFCDSDLPAEVREASLFNLSTLRSQTVFRTADGNLFGWEGCCDQAGCCEGSCTHVWNYEQATAFLYGDLSRSMREVEFLHATDQTGFQAFRKALPLEADDWHCAAADGQMGTLMKLYRDWKLSGDDAWLEKLWPRARKALEFCWLEGSWDADRDGVMEGCQHNTMDVEYFGPNPQMTGWYLGALRAAQEMARHLGQDSFAETCAELFASGSAWMDANLFNGQYYQQIIQPPASPDDIRPGLTSGMGAEDVLKPQFQIGPGCLIDQLVGQYMAHVCNLGYLHDRKKVRKTLRSIYRCNFRRDLKEHFNPMRTYALADEAATLMCSYPRGDRPAQPFPYFAEAMTGFEYTAAVGMIQEGMTAEGLELIRAIRNRYDGLRRNPFDEYECGHHYARAMASWAALLALTGFDYDARKAAMAFAMPESSVQWFWSTGYAFGTIQLKPAERSPQARLKVLGGRLRLRRISVGNWGCQWPGASTFGRGDQPDILLRPTQ